MPILREDGEVHHHSHMGSNHETLVDRNIKARADRFARDQELLNLVERMNREDSEFEWSVREVDGKYRVSIRPK